MNYLWLILEPKLSTGLLRDAPAERIDIGEDAFVRRAIPDVVFYDWLLDQERAIRALEIHLPPDHPALRGQAPLSEVSFVDTRGCFPRIFLFDHHDTEPSGREAFGDLWFYEDATNRLALVIGVEEWLSLDERQGLIRDLGL